MGGLPAASLRKRRASRAARTVALAAAPLALFVALAVAPRLVDGQSGDVDMSRRTPTSTQWNAPTLVIFIFGAVLMLPLELVGLVLLIRRRRYFPIAGRGFVYLLVVNLVSIFGACTLALLPLVFPDGLPCGLVVITAMPLYFTTFAYVLRGWIFVFRQEVMNFLAERQWRMEQADALLKRRSVMETEAAAATAVHTNATMPNSVASARPWQEGRHVSISNASTGGDSSAVHRLIPIPNNESDIDQSPESIPGHVFVIHRRYTEPRYLLAFCMLGFIYVCGVIIVIILADPDVAVVRAWRRSHGLPPDPEDYGSQWTAGHLLNSPPCFTFSPKILLYQSVFSVWAVPLGVWVIWRLRVNEQRKTARAEEQRAFAQREELLNNRSDGVKSNKLSSKPSSVAPASAPAHDDLDDGPYVKREFSLEVVVALSACADYFLCCNYAPAWAPLCTYAAFAQTFLVAIPPALWRSYSISRRHRKMIQQANGGSSAAGNKRGFVNTLPHQRPYYTLKFILHNPHTYPVLLKFLQKEYSSENALFYTEVRALKSLCVKLERAMPSWPQGREGGTSGGSSGGSGSVLASVDVLQSQVQSPHHTGLSSGISALPVGVLVSVASAPPPSSTLLSPSGISVASSKRPLVRAPTNRGGLVPVPVPVGGADRVFAFDPSTTSPTPSIRPLPTLSIRPAATSTTTPSSGDPFPATAGTAAGAAISSLPLPQPAPAVSSPTDFSALHADAQQAKAWCLRLHDEFLAKSAMYEINIPDDLSALVSSQIAQLRSYEPTPLDSNGVPRIELTETEEPQPPPFALSLLFAQTQLAILDLVETDSFRRFILTAEFRALIAAADEAEAARREMQADLQGHMAAMLHEAMQHTLAPSGVPAAAVAPAATPVADGLLSPLDPAAVTSQSCSNSPMILLPGSVEDEMAMAIAAEVQPPLMISTVATRAYA